MLKDKPAAWQFRHYDQWSSPPGWTVWENVVVKNEYVNETVESRVEDIRSLIASGHKYELRPLFERQPPNWFIHRENCWDSIPYSGQKCLIAIPVCGYFEVEAATYNGDGTWDGAWCSTRGEKRPYKVAAWMPFPAYESLRELIPQT